MNEWPGPGIVLKDGSITTQAKGRSVTSGAIYVDKSQMRAAGKAGWKWDGYEYPNGCIKVER